MNWMRGLLRLWIILSLIWIAMILVMTQPWNAFMVAPATAIPAAPAPKENRFSEFIDETEGPRPRYQADGSPELTAEQAVAVNAARGRLAFDGAVRVALAALLPPALLLLLLVAGRWVALGFREGAQRDL
jgi:hypothetical protein